MRKEIVQKILNETEVGYDLMAQKFSETRKFFWRGLEFIGDYAQDGDRVLDFGCGNGRLLELLKNKNIEYFGVDVAQKLLDLAKMRYPSDSVKFAKINPSQTTLPFPDNYFNAAYSVAVFHHFPEEHAEKMVRELWRIIKPGGYAAVTVWNLYQKNYWKNVAKNWLAKTMGESELDWNGCYINFKNNAGAIFPRYHHAYTKKEIKNIFAQAGFQVEKCEVQNGRNIILIGRKPKLTV